MFGALALLIDDDPALYSTLAARLAAEGWRLVISSSAEHAVELGRAGAPTVAMVRARLRDGDGLAVCRALRSAPEMEGIPLLVLGSGADAGERARAFAAGADEYAAAPVEVEEVMARLRLFRRYSPPEAAVRALARGPVVLDRAAHEVRVEGTPVPLTATEFRLLETFLTHPRVLLSREELLAAAWSRKDRPAQRSVDVCVGRLRRKLEGHGAAGHWILAVRGYGYTWAEMPD